MIWPYKVPSHVGESCAGHSQQYTDEHKKCTNIPCYSMTSLLIFLKVLCHVSKFRSKKFQREETEEQRFKGFLSGLQLPFEPCPSFFHPHCISFINFNSTLFPLPRVVAPPCRLLVLFWVSIHLSILRKVIRVSRNLIPVVFDLYSPSHPCWTSLR